MYTISDDKINGPNVPIMLLGFVTTTDIVFNAYLICVDVMLFGKNKILDLIRYVVHNKATMFVLIRMRTLILRIWFTIFQKYYKHARKNHFYQ